MREFTGEYSTPNMQAERDMNMSIKLRKETYPSNNAEITLLIDKMTNNKNGEVNPLDGVLTLYIHCHELM